MRLLEENEEAGYPLEYLLSRIRGKRVALISDWESLVRSVGPLDLSTLHQGRKGPDSADALWGLLLTEFSWVFRQMDRALREIFRPFFLYSELRTLFFCLRYRMKDETAKLERILNHSLFSKQLKRVLRKSKDLVDMIAAVENVFVGISPEFKGIKAVFLKDGLKGVEQMLTNTYLKYVIRTDLHPHIRVFFSRIIDARNIITVYKYLRWEVSGTPLFLSGGRFSCRRLREITGRANIFGVISLVSSLTGVDVEKPDASGVENALYKGMTRFLRRQGRDISGIGLILDYLWRCSVEVRNLGVLIYSGDVERESMLAELVQ